MADPAGVIVSLGFPFHSSYKREGNHEVSSSNKFEWLVDLSWLDLIMLHGPSLSGFSTSISSPNTLFLFSQFPLFLPVLCILSWELQDSKSRSCYNSLYLASARHHSIKTCSRMGKLNPMTPRSCSFGPLYVRMWTGEVHANKGRHEFWT